MKDSELIPRYILAPSDTQFFAQLFAVCDIDSGPDEEKAERLAKKHLQIRRLASVLEGARQDWFRIIMAALERRLFKIDSEDYWEALRNGNQAVALGLEIERTAIFMLLKSIHDIPKKLAAAIAEFHSIEKEKDDGSIADARLEIDDYEDILNPPTKEGQ